MNNSISGANIPPIRKANCLISRLISIAALLFVLLPTIVVVALVVAVLDTNEVQDVRREF
jgi:hypothetical protein